MMEKTATVKYITFTVVAGLLLAYLAIQPRNVNLGSGPTQDPSKGRSLAGVPLYGHERHGYRSDHAASEFKSTQSHFRQLTAVLSDYLLILEDGASDETVGQLCHDGRFPEISCLHRGHPSNGGLAFATIRAAQNQLQDLLAAHADEVRFVELDGEVMAIPEISGEATGAASVVPWGLDRIDARSGTDDSYEADSDGQGVHVYVADTGIRTTHEDFEGRAIPTLEIVGSGEVECAPDSTNCAIDNDGHGTHCAGTIGGKSYGVAKGATLHAVKVLADDGVGSWSWFIAALNWVASKGDRPAVLSASLGGGGTLQSVKAAVDQATQSGVTVVVAAGNSNSDACNFSPAYVPSAITVGATSLSDARAGFSNYGSCLDILAPGVNILSAGHSSDTASARMSGTSMACPHVAGAAALLLNASSDLSPMQVSDALRARGTVGAISDLQDGSPDILLYVGNGTTMTSTTTTTTLPDFGGLPWAVTKGDCIIERSSPSCATSPNYPGEYGTNEECTILVNNIATGPIVVEHFDTEDGYDKLTVNSQIYMGNAGPAGVVPSGQISWQSDHSVQGTGWKLCIATGEQTTPVPAPVPTPAPTPVPTSVPTLSPTPLPTAVPTPVPSQVPTPAPTQVSTPAPTPTQTPTLEPTPTPTLVPTPASTPEPTLEPTPVPAPTPVPTPSNRTDLNSKLDVLEDLVESLEMQIALIRMDHGVAPTPVPVPTTEPTPTPTPLSTPTTSTTTTPVITFAVVDSGFCADMPGRRSTTMAECQAAAFQFGIRWDPTPFAENTGNRKPSGCLMHNNGRKVQFNSFSGRVCGQGRRSCICASP